MTVYGIALELGMEVEVFGMMSTLVLVLVLAQVRGRAVVVVVYELLPKYVVVEMLE